MRLVEALGKVESGGATLLLEYGAMYIPIHTPVVLHLNGTANTQLEFIWPELHTNTHTSGTSFE